MHRRALVAVLCAPIFLVACTSDGAPDYPCTTAETTERLELARSQPEAKALAPGGVVVQTERQGDRPGQSAVVTRTIAGDHPAEIARWYIALARRSAGDVHPYGPETTPGEPAHDDTNDGPNPGMQRLSDEAGRTIAVGIELAGPRTVTIEVSVWDQHQDCETG